MRSRRHGPDIRSLLSIAGVLCLLVLIIGGFAQSVLVDGRAPKLRLNYLDSYGELIRSQPGHIGLQELRLAATLDFDSAEAAVQLLVAAERAGDAESLQVALRQLVNHYPDDAELHARLAQVLLEVGQIEEATLHSAQAVQLDPESQSAREIDDAVKRAAGKVQG